MERALDHAAVRDRLQHQRGQRPRIGGSDYSGLAGGSRLGDLLCGYWHIPNGIVAVEAYEGCTGEDRFIANGRFHIPEKSPFRIHPFDERASVQPQKELVLREFVVGDRCEGFTNVVLTANWIG